ncbi:MAG: hypothetical protein WA484_11900 [Solirubrobacteraceae bacterium]
MTRFGLVGAVLAVAFVSGVLVPVSASAVSFLLAEWLVNGSPVTSELLTETTGELLLEDSKAPFVGKASVLCSGILDGWIAPNSLGWISELLTLAGVAVSTTVLSGTALECTAQSGCETSTKPKVWFANLGWETEVELMEDGTEAFFVDLILPHAGGGNPGWEITECLVLGVSITDECTAAESVAELKLEGTTLLEKFSKIFSELAGVKLANCSQGGTESGAIEGEDSVILGGGGELSVSSEGGGVEATSLSTALSGEGKEGETLTVVEGLKVKDKATLSGKNASTATGKVTYNVYSDNECKTLVTTAGEVTVSGGSVPASSEEELKGGKTYYWQAHYGGDSKDAESTSPCTEILNVKAVLCMFPFCEPSITPAVKVAIPVGNIIKECTAGPIMQMGTESFLLTAGHCLGRASTGTQTIEQKMESATPSEPTVQREIGLTVTFNFNNTKKYDTAEVKIEAPITTWALSPTLVEWGMTTIVTPVVGEAENAVGELTCISGATSRLQCGRVLRVGVTNAGVENLNETSVRSVSGDSGAPEFVQTNGDVKIQGTQVSGEGADYFPVPPQTITGELTANSSTITRVQQGIEVCQFIEEYITLWRPVGPEITATVAGIPAETTVTGCSGAQAEITMSARATQTGVRSLTIGYRNLSSYEPMAQIRAVFPGQTLLVR